MQSTMVKRFPDISSCTDLQILVVKHSTYLTGFDGLPECAVEELNLSWCRCFTETRSLLPLQHLQKLDLAYCRSIADIEPLKTLTKLRQLSLAK